MSVFTCAKALVGHVPNQSTTHLLNSAGEVAQRPAKPSLAGFMVNTTWRPRWTFANRAWRKIQYRKHPMRHTYPCPSNASGTTQGFAAQHEQETPNQLIDRQDTQHPAMLVPSGEAGRLVTEKKLKTTSLDGVAPSTAEWLARAKTSRSTPHVIRRETKGQ